MPKRTFQPNRRHRVEDARLSRAHEDQGGRRRAEPPPRRRPQARLRQRRLPRLSPSRRIVSAGMRSASSSFRLDTSGTAMSIPPASLSESRLAAELLQRQSLAGARLRKHADYQRAYAAGRKRQSRFDELVSGAAAAADASALRRPARRAHRGQGAGQGARTQSHQAPHCAKCCGAMSICCRQAAT